MKNATTDELAQIIWDYMLLHEEPQVCDAIFCLCSRDTRVAERAADLMLNGYGKSIIFSGGLGRLTKDVFAQPEAAIFASIAVKKGVDPQQIIIENKSTNTGQNIRFTYELLTGLGLHLNSFILVQKPYMERRTLATFKKQWPDHNTKVYVTSPLLSYEEYVAGSIPKDEIINIMVGDLQRIYEYPKLGYQTAQKIPDKVWLAYDELVKRGFDRQLITG